MAAPLSLTQGVTQGYVWDVVDANGDPAEVAPQRFELLVHAAVELDETADSDGVTWGVTGWDGWDSPAITPATRAT